MITKYAFDKMLERLLDEGIEITMQKPKDSLHIVYDLNTQMKSPLYVTFTEKGCEFTARYGERGTIEDWEDLMHNAYACLHGRDFANSNWWRLLIKEGYLHEINF